MEINTRPLAVDKDAEIAHLKDLLAFATRPDRPSSTMRLELSTSGDGGFNICITSPGADEEQIARLAMRQFGAIVDRNRSDQIATAISDAIFPILNAAMVCNKERHRKSGYCAECLTPPIRAALQLIDAHSEAEPEDEPPSTTTPPEVAGG